MLVEQEALNVANYWRASLADAALGRGSFGDADIQGFVPISDAELTEGQLSENLTSAIFATESETVLAKSVILRPYIYRSVMSHAERHAARTHVITPLACKGTVDRKGKLSLPNFVGVPRDLLAPLDRKTETIGELGDLDDFLTRFPSPNDFARQSEAETSWQLLRRYCRELAKAVFPDLDNDSRFKRVEGGFLDPSDAADAVKAIIPIYDLMMDERPAAPLFHTFAAKGETESSAMLPRGDGFARRLAHASTRYALADAQRTALDHLLVAEHGDITTVNGPPGTGKTTLLLTVVATLWARAALAEDEAPIILAASNNNQAVTNIIDAFGEDFENGNGPFAGRWLPNIQSFGSFFPAEARKKEAASRYHTEDFFAKMEDPGFLEIARKKFLKAAVVAFPNIESPDVDAVRKALHERLRTQVNQLQGIEASWLRLSESQRAVFHCLGSQPEIEMEQRNQEMRLADEGLLQATRVKGAWEEYLAHEPIWLTLMGWLPAVARKRLARARNALAPLGYDVPDGCNHRQIDEAIGETMIQADARNTLASGAFNEGATVMAQAEDRLRDWIGTLASFRISADIAGTMSLNDCEPHVDKNLRFEIFLTTTHYWEARWLLDMAAIDDPAKEKVKKGRITVTARWHRRMKLTPCAVCTFYKAPSLMQVSRYQDSRYIDGYLFDTADLLIVDEAGQVAPEIGGASFALARRALVIGDTAQIPPIWAISGPIDTGNLKHFELIDSDKTVASITPFQKSGRTASSGSIMHVAQHASRFRQDEALPRGLNLYEHRRCFDEIIAYCNALCYSDQLVPLRGPKALSDNRDGLPAIGYLQIDGLADRPNGKSRQNLTEAATIANWLAEHRHQLETAYPGQCLEQIVGIVTPFAAQSVAICASLKSKGINTTSRNGLVVGTVHSFQGAQRPVILFSSTYSRHDDGDFIDRDNSLLNVAVSRAMNSFLVFGDMNCFSSAPPTSPRGILGRFLFNEATNGLSFPQAPRADLGHRGHFETLTHAEEHDRFLHQALREAVKEIYIVTPWITRKALDQSGLLNAIADTAHRKVAVFIYTDQKLNEKLSGNEGLAQLKTLLEGVGATVFSIRDVHSKIVAADGHVYCVGSFNWLSAVRQGGTFARHETSLVYRGPSIGKEIELVVAHLKTLAVTKR